MASRKQRPPKEAPKVVDSFKNHGWWISRDDKLPILRLSDYAWEEKDLWCGLTYGAGYIAKVAEVSSTEEQGLCEVFMRGMKSGEPSSYILRTKNIMRSPDCLLELKFGGLPKYRKWWSSVGSIEQDLREKMVFAVSSMNANEKERLKVYMEKHERAIAVFTSRDGGSEIVPTSSLEEDVIIDGLSFYVHRRTLLDKVLPPTSNVASTSKKRNPSSILSFSQGGGASSSANIGLSVFDFDAPPQPSKKISSRSRSNLLVGDGSTSQTVLKKDKMILPTPHEIESGYVFGRDHFFYVDIANVRPASNILTNQRMLNTANAEFVYKRLRENQLLETNVMTLRPMEYLPLSNEENVIERYTFKGEETRIDFLRCLNAMPGDSFEEKRDNFLPLVIWEPVDGQHILHACQVLAQRDREAGLISEAEYEKSFMKRPAQVVAYDEEFRYLVASCKKNEENTERIYHSTVGETLAKMRAVWKQFGSPNPYNDEDIDRRRLFLQCLPSITGVRLGKDGSEFTVSKMNLQFRDYISMATVSDDCWIALNNMCKSYDQGFTYYSEKARKEAVQQEGVVGNTKSKKFKLSERPRMSITWLRPLQGTSGNDFVLLCQGATVTEEGHLQKVYFGASSKSTSEMDVHTLQYLADTSKLRTGIHNALKWLDAEASGGIDDKKNWLSRDVQKYGDTSALDFFGRDATKDFKSKWVHLKDFTSFEAMEKHSALIPSKVRIHLKLILEGKSGLFANGKELFIGSEGVWNLEFNFSGVRGAGMDTTVKVGGNIFSEVMGKFGSPALWVFDCRKGQNGQFWTEMEYKSIVGIISKWMEDVPRWNAIFMLPAGENADMVIELLGLKTSLGWHVTKGNYVFSNQCQASGSVIRDGQRIIAKYTPVGPIIFVIHHPPTAPVADNLAANVKLLDSIFVEPRGGWDLCTKYRDARCPAVVDEIIESYYRPGSWMIVAHGISHMIHTLAGKTTEVIIFESDENIALWLRRWKREAVDGIKPGDGEEKLWEDGEVDSSETSNESSDDSLCADEVQSPAPKRMKTTNIQGKEKNVVTNQVARKSLLQDFDGEENLSQEEEIIASTPNPERDGFNLDGYKYFPEFDLWFDGEGWNTREEVPNIDVEGRKTYKYVKSIGPGEMFGGPSTTSNATDLDDQAHVEVIAGLNAAEEFINRSSLISFGKDAFSLGLGNTESQT